MVTVINWHNVYLFEDFTLALSPLDLAVTKSSVVLTVYQSTIYGAEATRNFQRQIHFINEFPNLFIFETLYNAGITFQSFEYVRILF